VDTVEEGTTPSITTMSTASDDELIRWSQSGDREAFGALVRRHQRSALRIATVALGSPTDAPDVTQEAFIKAFRAIGRFKNGQRFEPWLFRIVTNTAKNYQRSSFRRDALANRVSALAVVPEPGPGDVLVQQVESERVVNALNTLAYPDRLILTYRWYEQLSEAEIAHALGCRKGTVKSRLSRATARLRAAMEER
ncbi:MAG: RNA polymerase sigma factor, partial [Acidimicrobiia bacterium]